MSRYIDADRIDWRLIIPTNPTIAEENMIHLAKKLVERQPTADVREVVRGEWVATWHQFFKTEVLKCSACNNISLFASCYCPNCGADMRKRREDDRF